ncbi:MAG: DUF1501 domain-containing protein [Solirubrobacteraceae bacterium]|nr:DUF1501 domain-containing protein [Solirubrobacteraceae bacterium]
MSHRCCTDWTRSHDGIARAGAGLPAIEPGMPTPAGTGLSRRSLLLRGAGLALSVYGAGKLLAPEAFEAAIAEAAGDHRVVVSMFMDGGADNFSILAPAGHARYATLRPTLAIADDPARRFAPDPSLVWHPDAEALRQLWDSPDCGVAVAPAIGYPAPNYSHFTSRHYWEVGALDAMGSTGWLGRYLDRVGSPANPIQGLSFSGALSPALATNVNPVAATDSIGSYDFGTHGTWGAMTTRLRDAHAQLGALGASDPALAYARRVHASSAQLRTELSSATSAPATDATAGYPTANSSLKTRLQSLARLLHVNTAGDYLPIRAVTVDASGGWDTHSGQAGDFGGNLRTTSENLRAFWQDLRLRGLDHRVVILLWTEFGRRPEENGSAGTDHGAAGTAFVIGRDVQQGMIGEFPGLATSGIGAGLDGDGNLRHTADYRALYCALLEQWMQTDADGIIPGASALTQPVLL